MLVLVSLEYSLASSNTINDVCQAYNMQHSFGIFFTFLCYLPSCTDLWISCLMPTDREMFIVHCVHALSTYGMCSLRGDSTGGEGLADSHRIMICSSAPCVVVLWGNVTLKPCAPDGTSTVLFCTHGGEIYLCNTHRP